MTTKDYQAAAKRLNAFILDCHRQRNNGKMIVQLRGGTTMKEALESIINFGKSMHSLNMSADNFKIPAFELGSIPIRGEEPVYFDGNLWKKIERPWYKLKTKELLGNWLTFYQDFQQIQFCVALNYYNETHEGQYCIFTIGFLFWHFELSFNVNIFKS